MTFTSFDIAEITCMGIRELAEFYEDSVDHDEYPDFSGWLWDMERSAVLYRHEG